MRIGVVGLGPMGARMAARLLDAGHVLRVHNRSPGKAGALLERGATEHATPAEAARGAELVLSMVADDDAADAVTLGRQGIADGLEADAVHVSSSTISVALARRLADAHAERGQHFISATVLGRPPAVDAGKLYVMAAGAPDIIERVRPALAALGQRVFVTGDAAWMANLVKLSANFMIMSTIEQLAEVFAVNEKAGIAPALVFEVLSQSFCSAPVHLNYGKLVLERDFSPPGGPMSLGAKDTALFLDAGEALATPLPMASLLRDRFIASIARGDGELDFAAIANRAREDAGLDM